MGQPHPLTREIVPGSPADAGPLRTPYEGTSGPRPDDAGDADDTRSTGVIALEEGAGLPPAPRRPARSIGSRPSTSARRRAPLRVAQSRARAAAPHPRVLQQVAARLAARARPHRLRMLLAIAGLALGFAAPLLLARVGLTSTLDAGLRALDLDDERIHLIDQLLLTLTGSLIAAAATRRRLAPLVGAALAAVLLYVIPFVGQAQQPPAAVGGVTQVLVPGALAHVIATLAALCILAAAVGAALGFTLSDLTLGPALVLGKGLWTRLRLPKTPVAPAPLVRAGLSLVLCAFLVALVSAVGDAGSLLANGLSSSLYAVGPATPPLGGSPVPGDSPAPHGTVLRGTYPSPALGGALRTFYIYLPPSYSSAATKRYPIFYLLHGSPGDPHQWMSGIGSANALEDILLAEGKMRETILVAPDGNGPVYRSSQWANAFDGRQRVEDAIVVDLVRYIDAHYRTLADPANRAIGGNSEGGYGAVNLALHHPDVFGAAASVGGFFEIESGHPGIFGQGLSSAAYQLYNSPSRYVQTAEGAKAARVLRFVIGVATRDGLLYQDGVNFYYTLSRENITAQLVTLPGSHVWSVWRGQMAVAFQTFDPPDGATPTPSPTPTRNTTP